MLSFEEGSLKTVRGLGKKLDSFSEQCLQSGAGW